MRAGKLKHKITIERFVSVEDEYGSESEGQWNEFKTVRAEVRPIAGKESLRDQVISSEITASITLRFISGVTASDRIVFKGRIFEIVSPPINIREAGRWMEIKCKEVFGG